MKKVISFLAVFFGLFIFLPLLNAGASADNAGTGIVYKTQITAVYDRTYKILRYETEAFCTGSTADCPHNYTYQWERVKISDAEEKVMIAGILRTRPETDWPWEIMDGENSCILELDLSEKDNDVLDYYYRCTVGDNEGCVPLVSNKLNPNRAIEEYFRDDFPADDSDDDEDKTEAERVDQEADPFEYVAVWHCTNSDRTNGRIVVHSSWNFSYEFRASDALGNSNDEWKKVPGGDICGLSCPKGENASQWYVIRGTLGNIQKTKAIQVGYDPKSEAAGIPLELTFQTLQEGDVTVCGMLPDGAFLEVNDNISRQKVADYIGDDELVAAYDISIYYSPNGVKTEYEPEEGNMLTVTIDTGVSKGDNVTVTHLQDDNSTEIIDSEVLKDGSVEFKSDSFSIYIVTLANEEETGDAKVEASIADWYGLKELYRCGDSIDVTAQVTVKNTGGCAVTISKSDIGVLGGSIYSTDGVPDETTLQVGESLTFNLKCSGKMTVSNKQAIVTVKHSEKLAYSKEIPTEHDNRNSGWCFYLGCDTCLSLDARITSGANRTYYKNNTPVFTTNMIYRKDDGHTYKVVIDGSTIKSVFYEVYDCGDNKLGIKLSNELVSTLTNKEHRIQITESGNGGSHTTKDPNSKYSDGSYWFRISSAVDTGDTFDSPRIAVIMVLSLGGVVLSYLTIKKKQIGWN